MRNLVLQIVKDQLGAYSLRNQTTFPKSTGQTKRRGEGSVRRWNLTKPSLEGKKKDLIVKGQSIVDISKKRIIKI